MSKSNFKAPQKALQSSWRDECYRKPKTSNIIKKSLGNRPQAIGKIDGSFIPTDKGKGAYEY